MADRLDAAVRFVVSRPREDEVLWDSAAAYRNDPYKAVPVTYRRALAEKIANLRRRQRCVVRYYDELDREIDPNNAAQAVGAGVGSGSPPATVPPTPADLAALLREADANDGSDPQHTRDLLSRLAAALRRQGELVERGIEGRVSHNFGFSATVNVGAIDWPVGTRVLVRSIQADAARATEGTA